MNTYNCNDNETIKQNVIDNESEYNSFYWYNLKQELLDWTKKYNNLINNLKPNDELKKLCDDFYTNLKRLKSEYEEIVNKLDEILEQESVLPDCECDTCDRTRYF